MILEMKITLLKYNNPLKKKDLILKRKKRVDKYNNQRINY